MNFLITGGAGFIGSTFSKILLKNKHKVCVIDYLIKNNEYTFANKLVDKLNKNLFN